MQSVNCVPTNGLKNVLLDQTRAVVVHKVKPAVNRKK